MKIAFIRPNICGFRVDDTLEIIVFAARRTHAACDRALVLRPAPASMPLDQDVDLLAMTVETYISRRAYRSPRTIAAAAIRW